MTHMQSSTHKRGGVLHTLYPPLTEQIERDGIAVIEYPDDHPETLEPLGRMTVSDDSHARIWAPPWFRVRIEREGLPRFELTVGKADGRYRCLEVTNFTDPTNGYVDGESLRKLPIPSLVRDAVELVSYEVIATYDDPDVLDFVRSFLVANVADPDSFDPSTVRPGDYLRLPSFMPSQFAPESYAEFSQRDIDGAYLQQTTGHVSDDEFVRAWHEADAKDLDVQYELAHLFGMRPGSVRNRAGRLRKKGRYLPSRRGRKPKSA
jgi:hypothetical protein